MTDIAPRRRRRALGFGIAATVVAALGILSVGLVILLAVTIDENFGWFLIVVIPGALLAGAIGGILGIVGLVFARRDRGGYAWPAVGLVLGAGQLLIGTAILGGPVA
ncbi:hypothetical protein [Microbacterium radiodurans]|uniref:Uncharacterized protein n=1 Tax=Microbacterium radiodurans TaxID=661398 RepID=A0A5J5IV93_9MICO|nr:hypothetical protein [Microbacterium radiodurans]KAA9089848.1 hypothetical protein F6B42_05185 [Microbacterium radiodurans]